MSLQALTTVYGYRHPEVRATLDELVAGGFPHAPFLSAASPPGALDGFHEPVIDAVLEFYRHQVADLKRFPHRYPTSGSAEGIREVMSALQLRGVREIYVFDGDYEGFQAVAEQRGMAAHIVSRAADPTKLRPGFWFLSNPSAIDGNVIPARRIMELCEAGHQIFYDLAYLGATHPHHHDLSHPNVFAAVISFSKTFGLFYDRIGFTFSRAPIPSLVANRWFKSLFALLIAKAVVDRLAPDQLYRTCRRVQAEIVAAIAERHGIPLRASDAFLLAHLPSSEAERLPPPLQEQIKPYLRGPGYRFCLTPYFLARDPDAREAQFRACGVAP